MRAVKIRAVYKINCPMEFKDDKGCVFVNREIDLEICKKCKHYKGSDVARLEVVCGLKNGI